MNIYSFTCCLSDLSCLLVYTCICIVCVHVLPLQLSEFDVEREEYQKKISTLEYQVQKLTSGAVSQEQLVEITSQSRIQSLEGQVHSLQSQLEEASQDREEGREELLSLLESERIAKAQLESQPQSLREKLLSLLETERTAKAELESQQRKYFEQVTASTMMVSDVEEREKRLKWEKAKLERKLEEAEKVAAQVDTAIAQVHTMSYVHVYIFELL